jgi:hypothetical protein
MCTYPIELLPRPEGLAIAEGLGVQPEQRTIPRANTAGKALFLILVVQKLLALIRWPSNVLRADAAECFTHTFAIEIGCALSNGDYVSRVEDNLASRSYKKRRKLMLNRTLRALAFRREDRIIAYKRDHVMERGPVHSRHAYGKVMSAHRLKQLTLPTP